MGRARLGAVSNEEQIRPLRVLARCGSCSRQYDASSFAAGATLLCDCGARLEVPTPQRGEAPVVRCSACGASRGAASERCLFCESPFTNLERGRNTVCPACCARIADRARFCSACATPIDPRPAIARAPSPAGERDSTPPCPACRPPARLHSRVLPALAGALFECDHCSGLWLGRELFAELERRAQHEASSLPSARRVSPRRQAVEYRRCAECGKRMHRKNYGGSSGIVVDLCGAHGLWFDADELDQALTWIRTGGLAAARRREAEVQRDTERALAARQLAGGAVILPPRRESSLTWYLQQLADWLADRLGRS